MAVDINKLLKLPQRERRKIAERLLQILSTNHSISELSKDEKIVFKNSWDKYISGKSDSYRMKFYNSTEMKKLVFEEK